MVNEWNVSRADRLILHTQKNISSIIGEVVFNDSKKAGRRRWVDWLVIFSFSVRGGLR